jgi:amidase
MKQHFYTPSVFHNTLGSHKPELAVESGGSITTLTLDAGGFDDTGEKVTNFFNPMTGPFFISGADVGDSLSIEILKIKLNRQTGYSLNTLSPNMVTANYAKYIRRHSRVPWKLDLENSVGFLLDAPPPLKEMRIPLKPMIGSIGVAPKDNQFITSLDAGNYGGNLDYPRIREGFTLHLPVFVPGGLLFIGDCHAAQGYGELLGSGIETSAEVSLKVTLHKGVSLWSPRGQDQEYLYTFGVAKPMDQALQQAITEMHSWLRELTKLEYDREKETDPVGLMMGLALEIDIANLFNPHYTAVCKINKSLVNLS